MAENGISRYALVDNATQIVINVCVWDGNASTWQPPAGTTAVEISAELLCEIGWTKEGALYAPPIIDAAAQALAQLREQRNARLAASDWTQAPDAPTANDAAWKVYRQALRDLPQQWTYPNAPQWPTAP